MVSEIWSAMDRHFCHFALFSAFVSPNNLEKLNFGKIKKTPGDIIISQMCIIIDNYMRYGS